jgi:hypothetical protein
MAYKICFKCEKLSVKPDFIRVQVDQNFGVCLPRLAVLVSIEGDRPRAWFPGPLGPYHAWFLGIDLSRDFKRVKVPGNPIKVRLVLVYFGRAKCLRSLFAKIVRRRTAHKR